MAKGADRVSLGAGLGLMATGALLLADLRGDVDVGLELFGVVVALLFAITGASLLWGRSRGAPVPQASPRRALVGRGEPAHDPALTTAAPRERLLDLYRGGFGIALIAGAALIVLSRVGALETVRDAIVTIVVAIVAFALILAPFWWRLGRNLAAERRERIRSQERAEVAAHIHDSVLQTLSLVQRRADDPREVTQLARTQERELRSWLFGEDTSPGSSLASAIRTAAAEVEDAHRVPVEVVVVGDASSGPRGESLVSAVREAIVNAAKFAPQAGPVAVYAELDPGRAEVFVRDRGPGFDPAGVPADRRGIRESIIGRMERSGGSARIRSGEDGTEVELAIELAARGGGASR